MAAAVMAGVPVWMFAGPVGPFRAPGVEGEGLYGALLSGAVTRGWLRGEVLPGTSEVLETAEAFWPASPLGAALQAVLPLDAGFALGLVVAVSVWLAGFGPWRLARVALPEAPPWAAAAAGLAVQVSPVVLRGVPGVDLGALAVGAVALGLAHPRWALLGGLASAPGAVMFALATVFGGGWRVAKGRPLGPVAGWAIAALPALALALPPSTLPGAMRRAEAPSAAAPGYLASGTAVFPLPPVEAEPILAAAERAGTGNWLASGLTPNVHGNLFSPPPDGALLPLPDGAGPMASDPTPAHAPDEGLPWVGIVLVPLQRLHGGPLAALGILAGLLFTRTRRFGLAGLGILAGTTLILGWQGAPGEIERDPLAVEQLRLVLSSAQLAAVPGGLLGWGVPVVVLAVPGLAALFGRLLPALPRTPREVPRAVLGAVVCFGLVGAGVPLENPRLAVPVVPMPPDPLVDTLRSVGEGGVLLFPSPSPPFFQGQHPWGRVLWEMAQAGRSTDGGSGAVGPAAIVRTLTALTDVPIDVSAAQAVWVSRDAEAFPAAVAGGWRYLLVDFAGIPTDARPRVDGFLAERVGMPVAREGERLLYDLTAGPADGTATPAQGLLPGTPILGEPPPGMPPMGEPPPGMPPMGEPPPTGAPRGAASDPAPVGTPTR